MFLAASVQLNDAVEPVVQLMKDATKVLLIVFCAAMSILAIVHSFSFAKAEDPQQKQVAKQKLNNLIIAFSLAFALLVLFSLLDKTLTTWVSSIIEN